jgi:UDP-N-acetylglucosamine 2-epimerase (non-hydrolysing)
MRVFVAAGTRPEAIKLAPVVLQLRRPEAGVDVLFCATGQHREMFDQVLPLFGLTADMNLDVMTPNQTLADVTASVLQRVTPALKEFAPDWVVVQGDTTTTMATALAAFYLRIPIAHVEAGLRTGDRFHPYPEEINRRIADTIGDLLFAPTELAAAHLRAEGIGPDRILVTGNTGIDALLRVAELPESAAVRPWLARAGAKRLVLVTTHRRENFGEPMIQVCLGLRTLAERFPDVHFLLPVHPNPNVRSLINAQLGSHHAFTLTPPLDYRDFVSVMKQSTLILSDSGGVQEEAPSLGKPVLVLRERTERQEAIDAGTAKLVGTDAKALVAEASKLLADAHVYRAMASRRNPFGDGHASARIEAALREHWARARPGVGVRV